MVDRDLRLPLLAATAWGGALVGSASHRWSWWLVGAVVTVTGLMALRRPSTRLLAAGAVVVFLAATGASAVRTVQMRTNPVAELADRHAAATLTGTVDADATVHVGPWSTDYLVRMTVTSVTGRGTTYRLRAPVLVIGDQTWEHVAAGSTVRGSGLLAPADGDLSGMLMADGRPVVVRSAGWWWRASGRLRGAIRDAAGGSGDAALLPALVDGDVASVPPDLVADFRTTGLTHLTAVSGTNLTLLVGFLLLVARWAGLRGRWLHAVALVGIAGFVVLAQAQPSVLRAAVMGGISLLGMGHNGRGRALRSLGGAVLVLVLVEPGLARSVGFALSVLATAGILLLAPGWRDALRRWMPLWLAEAISVPAAAQLTCTPVIAAISGQVSLVAVAANLLAEPAVGPATVLGLAGGLAGLAWGPLGRLVATPGRWCVAWLVVVARHGAGLPAAALGWGTGAIALVTLTLLTVAVALGGPSVMRHRWVGLSACLLLVTAMVVRLPVPG